jgi:hypothetical protein
MYIYIIYIYINQLETYFRAGYQSKVVNLALVGWISPMNIGYQ